MDNREREEIEFQRETRKWRIRRRFAVISFVHLLMLTLFYLIAPFHLTPEESKVFADFNSIMMTLIGFFSGIVMLYMGAVTYADQHVKINS
jgi:polyferredoxin